MADKPSSAPPAPTEAAKGNAVTAEGAGATADEALRVARRSAVQTALVALLDAPTREKNGPLLDEKVLAHSDDLIRRFDVLESGKEKRKGQDVYHTRIAATVDRRALTAKLEDAGLKVKRGD